MLSGVSHAALVGHPAQSLSINICRSNDANILLRNWQRNLDQTLGQFSKLDQFKDLDISLNFTESAVCNTVEEHACYSGRNTITCREDSLERLLYAIASLTALYLAPDDGQRQISADDLIRMIDRSKTGVIEIFKLIDFETLPSNKKDQISRYGQYKSIVRYAYGEQALNALYSATINAQHVRIKSLHPSSGSSVIVISDNKVAVKRMAEVFQLATKYVFSIIFGHEMAHALGKCHLNDKSVIEQEGAWQELISIQQASLLCENPLSASELNADACGVRSLQSTIHNIFSIESTTNADVLAKKIAIDIMSYLLFVGIDARDPKGFNSWEIYNGEISYDHNIRWPSIKGYMYAPLRMTAMAAIMLGNARPWNSNLGICGQAADIFGKAVSRHRYESGSIACRSSATYDDYLVELWKRLQKLNVSIAPSSLWKDGARVCPEIQRRNINNIKSKQSKKGIHWRFVVERLIHPEIRTVSFPSEWNVQSIFDRQATIKKLSQCLSSEADGRVVTIQVKAGSLGEFEKKAGVSLDSATSTIDWSCLEKVLNTIGYPSVMDPRPILPGQSSLDEYEFVLRIERR